MSLQGLMDLYQILEEVNKSFLTRIRAAVEYDANLNAVLNLHADSTIIKRDLDEMFEDLRNMLDGYGDIKVGDVS